MLQEVEALVRHLPVGMRFAGQLVNVVLLQLIRNVRVAVRISVSIFLILNSQSIDGVVIRNKKMQLGRGGGGGGGWGQEE